MGRLSYTLRDIPRLMHLHVYGTPPNGEDLRGMPSGTTDPSKGSDWMAELADIRKAWPKVGRTMAGSKLEAVYKDGRRVRTTAAGNAPLWVRAAGAELLRVLNKDI